MTKPKSEVTKELGDKKMPLAVPFILCSIFLERYSSAGILAILSLFLHRKLNYDPNVSTALFHTYEFLVYLFTFFGAIIAESWLGMFKTIACTTLVYSFGSAIVAFSGIETIDLPLRTISSIGLLITIAGVGCLKSNLSAFGGSQFKISEHSTKLSVFFSMQYFALKCGSTLARATFPILREDVKCFGMDDCYPLAFALPSIAMLVSFVIFMSGRKTFVKETTHDNMLFKVFGCVMTGITEKFHQQKKRPKEHWLDYAEDKHGVELVNETKAVLNVLVMYIPLPLFWALHAQQGSRWVFQAAKMNGDVGWFTIKPDQMILLNSLMGMLLIPVFENLFYPLLSRVGIKSPLQKMTLGGLCSGTSFIIAALVQFQIDKNFISILWMLPQYMVMVMGEIMLYTSNLNFAFTEAPANMKSTMFAFVYLTIAGGALIVILISGTAFFESQAYEFLFFAGILFVDIFLFAFLATRYKYVDRNEKAVEGVAPVHA